MNSRKLSTSQPLVCASSCTRGRVLCAVSSLALAVTCTPLRNAGQRRRTAGARPRHSLSARLCPAAGHACVTATERPASSTLAAHLQARVEALQRQSEHVDELALLQQVTSAGAPASLQAGSLSHLAALAAWRSLASLRPRECAPAALTQLSATRLWSCDSSSAVPGSSRL